MTNDSIIDPSSLIFAPTLTTTLVAPVHIPYADIDKLLHLKFTLPSIYAATHVCSSGNDTYIASSSRP